MPRSCSRGSARATRCNSPGYKRGVRRDTSALLSSKSTLKLNSALPKVSVDPQTYEVFADGELLTCEPAEVLPLAQRYLLL